MSLTLCLLVAACLCSVVVVGKRVAASMPSGFSEQSTPEIPWVDPLEEEFQALEKAVAEREWLAGAPERERLAEEHRKEQERLARERLDAVPVGKRVSGPIAGMTGPTGATGAAGITTGATGPQGPLYQP